MYLDFGLIERILILTLILCRLEPTLPKEDRSSCACQFGLRYPGPSTENLRCFPLKIAVVLLVIVRVKRLVVLLYTK
jgi:hypothetical protein